MFTIRDSGYAERNYLTADSTDYLLGGTVIYRNNMFSKLLFDGGYLEAEPNEEVTISPLFRGTMIDEDEPVLLLLQGMPEVIGNGMSLSWKFYNKDHLGNNREVIDQTGMVCQVVDYYPYGTPFSGPSYTINSSYQPFKYNGKEFDNMHGLNTYDYGARQYYSVLPVWDRPDPLAEKYYGLSPYMYCLGNPVKYVDPVGMQPDSLEAALMCGYSYGHEEEYRKQLGDRKWFVDSQINSPSGFKATLFKKTTTVKGKKKTEYAFAFAGTDFKAGSIGEIVEAIKDIAADITNYIGVGLSYQQAEAAYYAIEKSNLFKGIELTFVGHSLGGELAAWSSMLTGRTAITFNPASVNGQARWIGNMMYGDKHIIQYRTVGKGLFDGDPINIFQDSTFRSSQGLIRPVYINSKYSKHSIETFIKKFGR